MKKTPSSRSGWRSWKMGKPTFTDLIHIIGRLQRIIGTAMMVNGDRNPNREAETRKFLERGHELCQDTRNEFPENIRKLKNHWTNETDDLNKRGMV